MNLKALITGLYGLVYHFARVSLRPIKLDNIFLWNDENNLFSSVTLNLVLHLTIGFSSPAQ